MSKLMSQEANWHNVLAGELEKNSITPQTLSILKDEDGHCGGKISKMNLSDDKNARQAPHQARKLKSSFATAAEVRRETCKEYKERTLSALNQKMIAGELDKLRQHLAKLKRINASTNKVPLAPRPLRIRSHKSSHRFCDGIRALDASEIEEETNIWETNFPEPEDIINLSLKSKRQSFVSMPPLDQLGAQSSNVDTFYNGTSLPSVCGNSFRGNETPEKGPNTTPTSLFRDSQSDQEDDMDKNEKKSRLDSIMSHCGSGDSLYWGPKGSTERKTKATSQDILDLPQNVNASSSAQCDDGNLHQGKPIALKEGLGKSPCVSAELKETKKHDVDSALPQTDTQDEAPPGDSSRTEEAMKKSELERKRQVQKRAYSRWMNYVCTRTALSARNHQKTQSNNVTPSNIENEEKFFQREEKIAMVLGYIDRMKKSQPIHTQEHSQCVASPKPVANSAAPITVDVKSAKASSGPFENRFQAQRDLIKKQKMKLDEQEKRIQELTLAKLQEEAKSSHKDFLGTLDLLADECTVPVKLQVKSLKAFVNLQDSSTPEKFVERMELRAKEREMKKQLAVERKRAQEEERKKKMKEEEEKRLKDEEERKRQAMEKIREENIRRREVREMTRKEQEKMLQLRRQADRFNEQRLCLLGIRAFKNLLLRREMLEWKADDYCRKRTLRKALCAWKSWVDEKVGERVAVAVSFYNGNLLRKAFDRWKQAVEDSIRLEQVAEDMYEMKLQEKIFRKWCQYSTEQHIRMEDKLAEASDHYDRCILKKYFRLWRNYPEIAHIEREKERRKTILRKKVKAMLPDFRSASPKKY